MEELKQLIKEDKELIRTLDEHLKEFATLLSELNTLKDSFITFFQKQDKFMELMQQIMEKR
jgi:hypothetical protein